MGAANSKVEDDKALQLCRERKKFVRQALDGRCSLASSHVAYIQSLRSVGTALRKFVEPEAATESSPYASINATPESSFTYQNSRSHYSFPSPTISNTRVPLDNRSPSALTPHNSNVEVNLVQFSGFSSTKVEEKLPEAVTVTLTSSSTPTENTPRSVANSDSSPFDASTPPPEAPWDFFELSQENNDEISIHEIIAESETNGEMKSFMDDVLSPRDPLVNGQSDESGDEFDGHPTETLVRSFQNLNRVSDNISSKGDTSDSVFMNGGEIHSTYATPLKENFYTHDDAKTMPVRENQTVYPELQRDFISSMREIELLFFKASETGKEVPRMLEANKLHFRPLIPGKRGGTTAFFKYCFSCGDQVVQVPEEPTEQTSVKYLTWHRTSSYNSSRSPIGVNAESVEASDNLFDNTCMISGSHASTLDRLYAWERKLYDEVKSSQVVRRDYDTKCKLLRQLESKGESEDKTYKMRADVKDLHSRIRIAIQRIDSISTRIEELRDRELQPQLMELIRGLSRMWKGMSECHKLQLQIMSSVYEAGGTIKMYVQSEAHRQITISLENELDSLSSCFSKWMAAQKMYLQAINDWLFKCVFIPQNPSKKKKRPTPSTMLRNKGPSIYSLCGVWLDESEMLPSKEVVEAIKGLAAEIVRVLPLHDKNHGKGEGANMGGEIVREHASEDCISRFKSSLVGFLGQLTKFSEFSVSMYAKLEGDVASQA